MNFKKGQIITYNFPIRPTQQIGKSHVIEDFHRAVVLHSRGTPFNTVLIAPITSAKSIKEKNRIPSNYVEIKKADYVMALDYDSYINLDMTMPVDEKELQDLEKGSFKIKGILNEFDLYQLDYKITLTYELNKYLNTEFASELNKEFENVIYFIDKEIKLKIEQILRTVNNQEVFEEIIDLIDYLLNQIRENFIISKVKQGQYIE